MHIRRNEEIAELESRAGIVFPGAMDWLPRGEARGPDGKVIPGRFADRLDGRATQALDAYLAMDAQVGTQPGLVTNPNAGIPAFLTTYLDPKLIEVLLTPVKAAEIYGETKKGDWLTQTAMFAMVENTGFVASYGDFNEAGRSGANVNYPQRQSYLFQTITEWGEQELERMGLGRVDWAARLNVSAANTLLRFQNITYFFGVSGLQNYGGLNDPSLSAALTPATKAAGGTSWQRALPTEILADVQAMFAQLQTQSPGNTTRESRLTLGIDPQSDIYVANTNTFGLTAEEMIKKAFPNLTIKTAPQYLSGSTYSAQLIVEDWVDGQRTCESGFNEKMRAHRIVPDMSSFRQKKTAGTWGTIIYRPIGIASMAGI